MNQSTKVYELAMSKCMNQSTKVYESVNQKVYELAFRLKCMKGAICLRK